jgi:hypothetical protein
MAIQPFTPPQFGAQQQEQQPQAKRQRGTGFTNIGKMLGANIGAGQQMGQKIGQVVGSQAGKVKEGVEKSAQQFRTGYEEAKKEGLGTIGQVGSLVGQVGEGGKIGSGISGMSEEEAKKLGEQFANVKYAGPTQIGGQIGTRASALKGLAQGALTGQRNVLGSTLGRIGPYSRGQSILDTTLLGQDIAGQQAIRAANLEAARTAAMAQQEEQVAQNLAKQAQGLLGTGQPRSSSLKSEIEGKMLEAEGKISESAKKQAQDYYSDAQRLQKLMTDINDKKFDPSKITEKDIELINRMEDFGINTEMYIDPRERFAELSKNVLADIAAKGNVTYAGQSKISKDQESALKNISLMQKKEAPKSEEFKTNLFKDTEGEVADQLLKAEQEKQILELGQPFIKEHAANRLSGKSWFTNIEDLNKYIKDLEGYVASNQYPGFTEQYKNMLPLLTGMQKRWSDTLEKEKSEQKKTTVKDYLKSLYGIK